MRYFKHGPELCSLSVWYDGEEWEVADGEGGDGETLEADWQVQKWH